MIVYFGIAMITGTIGGFQITGILAKIANFIPFQIFRDTTSTHWISVSFSLNHEVRAFLMFFVFTFCVFALANYYRIRTK